MVLSLPLPLCSLDLASMTSSDLMMFALVSVSANEAKIFSGGTYVSEMI
jgi:hypothetical protein